MEDPTNRAELVFSNEKPIVVVCEQCDVFIHTSKAPGVDKIITCGVCSTQFVLTDSGLRKVK